MPRIVLVLLCLLSPVSFSQEQIGDWYWESAISEGSMVALTTNDTGESFGHICYDESSECSYFLINELVTCTLDDEIPALVQGGPGAYSISLICIDSSGIYWFSPFEDIDEAARNSDRVGVAIPLNNGEFSVSRFSLSGGVTAIDNMREAFMDTPAPSNNSRIPVKLPDSERL